MKKLIILVFVATIYFVACSDKTVVNDPTGFKGDDTYVVSATGAAPNEGDKQFRREKAERLALIKAKSKLPKELARERSSVTGESLDYEEQKIMNHFEKVMNSGIIIRSTFDVKQNCTILYQIKTKNLRSKVLGEL